MGLGPWANRALVLGPIGPWSLGQVHVYVYGPWSLGQVHVYVYGPWSLGQVHDRSSYKCKMNLIYGREFLIRILHKCSGRSFI